MIEQICQSYLVRKAVAFDVYRVVCRISIENNEISSQLNKQIYKTQRKKCMASHEFVPQVPQAYTQTNKTLS